MCHYIDRLQQISVFITQACVIPTHIRSKQQQGMRVPDFVLHLRRSTECGVHFEGKKVSFWFVSEATAACASVATAAPSGSIAIVVYYNKV